MYKFIGSPVLLPPVLSICLGILVLYFVAKKRGFNKEAIGTFWSYLVMIGAALILLPIGALLDSIFFPIK